MEKNVELNQVRIGENFILDDVEFVKLDECDGDALVLTNEIALKNVPFESETSGRRDRNNYCGSLVESALLTWLTAHQMLADAVKLRPIDLSSEDSPYGCYPSQVRLLTTKEYWRYYKLIPLTPQRYWLANGWVSEVSFIGAGVVYCVDPNGSVRSSGVYNERLSARPTLYLSSSTRVSFNLNEAEQAG